ncbi:MAG: 2-C-methyl-D-erythritol 4-phosphate cytidylyltransferase [Eubacteriales bacterium]|nr:2-C-methyl-D-erythritol 4-phosphate cytidylyltransferase [Eubacteriales bacterium]
MFGRKKEEKTERTLVYAVLPAAGTSRRMGGENKLLLELAGKPVIRYTLEALEACDAIDGIVLSCREEEQDRYHALYREWGLTKPMITTVGGETRTQSVYHGVLACPPEVAYVAIHDAARPFVLPEQIARTVEAAKRDTAAALAVPVKDSIKRIKNGRMVEDVKRDTIVAAQTPQTFDIDLIRAALYHVIEDGIAVTDDIGAVETLGQPTTMVEGDYNNIKITTREDILIGERILKERRA